MNFAFSSRTSWILASSTLLALFIGLFVVAFVPSKAQSVSSDDLFWIGTSTGNRLFSSPAISTITSPTNLTPTNPTYRSVTSDGTYLYFADTSNTRIARVDRSGSNRTDIATISSTPEQLTVLGTNLYYTTFNGGIWSVPLSGGTPSNIAPSGTLGLPSSGFFGIALNSTEIFVVIQGGGLYHATLSGSTVGTFTKNSDFTNFNNASATNIALNGSDLYFTSSSASTHGILKTTTANWDTAVSGWTLLDTNPSTSTSYGLSVLGSKIYFTSGGGAKVFSMGTDGSAIATLYAPGSGSNYGLVALPPATYTVTYTNGGGTGVDLAQTIAQGATVTLPSPSSCPASATDPCFTAPIGQRAKDWHVTTGTLSGGTTYPTIGQTITPTSNVTLEARWTGGPLVYSTTSGGPAASSIAMPNTAVSSTSTQTIFVKNSSSTAGQAINNINIPNTDGLSRTSAGASGACTTGTTLAANAECTITMSWTPFAAGSITSNTYIQIQYAGGAMYDSVLLTGTAATNKTVTFNFNGGSGTMSNQVAAFPTNLVANAYTRTGYSFSYWTMFSDGSGTQYLNQASFPFSNNTTLFANWSADSHVVTFNTDGGSSVANGSFNTDGSMNLPAAPTRNGYTFNGWFTTPTGGTALSSPYSPPGTSAITLYAQWSVDTSGGSGVIGNLPYTGNQTGQILGISGALLSIGLAITALAVYRRRKA